MPLRARMLAENWDNTYITELEQHITGLRQAVVSATLTQTLIQRNASDAYLLVDQNHTDREFGTLRGKNSAVAGYEAYIKATFPDDHHEVIGLVKRYATGVRESSWSKMVQLVKEFLVRQRTNPSHDGYFWKMASDNAKPWDQAVKDIDVIRLEILGMPRGDVTREVHETNLRRAVVTWHAFTQELLRCTAFPGNDQANENVALVRTESMDAVKHFRRAVGGAPLTADEMADLPSVYNVPLTCLRGALESSSLYTIKTIHGNVVTEAVVPHHRIFALYMTGQPQTIEHMTSFFENDTENEVTFMPQGLRFQIKDPNTLTVARPQAQHVW